MDGIRKSARMFVMAAIFIILGFAIGYMFRLGGETNAPLAKPESRFEGLSGLLRNKAAEGAPQTVEGRTLYTLCGHWKPLSLDDLDGVSPEQLKERFPSGQGWHVQDTGEKIIVTKDIKALCPEDGNQRHLGCFGEYIAVVKGPPGVNGGILEVTEIKLKSLPLSFQKEAEQGTLDFASAQSLLEALDSLDEFEN